MIKTWEEYYNDPEIVNEHPLLREIHAIRLKLHDERKGMTIDEKIAYTNAATARFRASCEDTNNPIYEV